ncbi:DUF2306 domain-containing protein [Actinomadura syzygii]|uniref:DUF2306 domain-containing protein n=1 Tax=Actinomadura syzygii TaxID=1427538 RepID=A0A5D0UHS1_9ACTN|nr:DUF2306 domain-containing protein [Actinomadura syzygii]TYC17617.1 DUF2306 domain-containing protein [Actinomadura syzygii]
MTTGSLSRAARRRWWWTLWTLLAVSALGIAGFAVPPYLTGNPADSNVPIDADVAWHYLSLGIHAVPAGLALVLGPFQFVSRLRVRRPRLHRVAGRIYMICILIAAAAAVFAAAATLGGLAVQVAFYLLVAAWLYTAAKAYRHIRRGEVQLHRIWMIRNYALTFAAVTLRSYLLIGVVLKKTLFPSIDFDELYTACVWASILGNVLVTEYLIVQKTLAPLARRRPGGRPATGNGEPAIGARPALDAP